MNLSVLIRRVLLVVVWTTESRTRYDRYDLRHPSDLTDEDWAIISPLEPPARQGGNKRTVDVRELINGLMYILGTGRQWAVLPKNLPRPALTRPKRSRARSATSSPTRKAC